MPAAGNCIGRIGKQMPTHLTDTVRFRHRGTGPVRNRIENSAVTKRKWNDTSVMKRHGALWMSCD